MVNQPATPVADKDAVALLAEALIAAWDDLPCHEPQNHPDCVHLLLKSLDSFGWRLSRVDETPPVQNTEYHVHKCPCGVPVMEESIGAWQQGRIRELMANRDNDETAELREALSEIAPLLMAAVAAYNSPTKEHRAVKSIVAWEIDNRERLRALLRQASETA